MTLPHEAGLTESQVAMAEALPHMVWTATPEGQVDYVSYEYERITGIAIADLDLKSGGWLQAVHPGDRDRAVQVWMHAVQHRIPYNVEFRIFHQQSNQYRWMLVAARPHYDAHGNLLKWFGTTADIEDRKVVEQRLRERENYLAGIFRSAPDPLLVVSEQGLIQDMNPAACRLFQVVAPRNLAGQALSSMLDPHDTELLKAQHRQALQGLPAMAECRVLGQQGGVRQVELLGTLMAETAEVLYVLRDVTAARREERLRALENRVLNAIAEGAPLKQIFTDVTLEVDQLLAPVRSSILLVEEGRLAHGAAPHLPDEYNRLIDGIPIAEGAGSCGTAAVRRQQVVVSDTFTDPLWVNYRKLAERFGLRACTSTPVTDANGQVLATFAIYFSVPSVPHVADVELIDRVCRYLRVAIQRTRQQAQLQRALRLEAVGQMTGGLAHDFNNLLTVIMGNAELLSDVLADNPSQRRLADMLVSAASRGADLTRRLLAFARRQPLTPTAVDTNDMLAGMLPLLRSTVGERVALELTRGHDVQKALVDAAQLESAVINLCLNARDAMGEGGQIHIRTSNVVLDQAYAATHPEVRAGQYVLIAVSDTGSGMDEAVMAHVFEPFFTTKEVGKGSGLGLSMVYGFMQQSSGHVKLTSVLGKGTTVQLYLPVASDPDSSAPHEPERHLAEPADSALGRRILVVEDNDLVRAHVVALLAELGHDVTEAATAADALACLDRSAQFDLLFTDVVMPGGVSGPDLARIVHARWPDLPVLFTSGYTDDALGEQGVLPSGTHLLHKPYRRADLIAMLEQVLA